jgi:hypothetical protein
MTLQGNRTFLYIECLISQFISICLQALTVASLCLGSSNVTSVYLGSSKVAGLSTACLPRAFVNLAFCL